MRVALLQLALDPRNRSRNVQGLTAAIDRAARHEPAPDLLVLPAACDTGGATPSRRCTTAIRDNVVGLFAHKAREWGVYLAVGLHRRAGDEVVHYAALFDPDGDVALRRQREASVSVLVWHCPWGQVAVSDSLALRPSPDGEASGGLLLAVPLRTGGAEEPPDGVNAAVVSAADHGPRKTYLRAADGRLLASAPTARETILVAEV